MLKIILDFYVYSSYNIKNVVKNLNFIRGIKIQMIEKYCKNCKSWSPKVKNYGQCARGNELTSCYENCSEWEATHAKSNGLKNLLYKAG